MANVLVSTNVIGNTALVAAAANTRYVVQTYRIVADAAVDVKFIGGAVDLTGPMSLAANRSHGPDVKADGWFRTRDNEALIINLSAAVNVRGHVNYKVETLPYVDLSKGQLYYWRMEEKTGARTDSVAARNLTDNGSVGFETGTVGYAALFNGSNFLSRASEVDLQLADKAFTLAAWAKPNFIAGTMHIAGKSNVNVNSEYQLFWNQTGNRGDFTWQLYPAGTYAGPVTLTYAGLPTAPPGNYYLVIADHDPVANLAGLRVGLSPRETLAIAAGVPGSVAAFRIGGDHSGAGQFLGTIDEVGIWNRVLNDAEAQALALGLERTFPFA